VHAWRAPERVDLEARIVRKEISFREAAIVFGLANGVFFERFAVFLRRGDGAGKLPQIEVRRRELKLSQLPRIRRRAIDGH